MLDLHERRASHSGIIPRSAPRYPTADTQHAKAQIHPPDPKKSERISIFNVLFSVVSNANTPGTQLSRLPPIYVHF